MGPGCLASGTGSRRVGTPGGSPGRACLPSKQLAAGGRDENHDPHPAQIPVRFQERQRSIPCSSRRRSPEAPAGARRTPQGDGRKALLAPGIPADPRPDRPDRDRSVTPEGRGFESRRSRRTRPANQVLLLSVLTQTTAGLPPVSRTDPAREISREPHAKNAAKRASSVPGWALGEPLGPRSSRADPARAC